MIGRVVDAYRAELLKLRHRTIGWAAFALAVVAVLLSAVAARVGQAATELAAGGGAVAATNGFVAFADGLGFGVGAGSLLLLVYAGLFMAEETELGTAKIVFSKPVRRVEVVLAKGLLLLTLAVVLVLVVAGTSLALAGALHGFGDVVERSPQGETIYVYHTADVMYGHALRAVPLLVPPLFAALALAFLMSSLFEQSGIAVGLSFGVLVASMVGTWLFDRAAPYLVTSYFGFATETLRGFATGEATAQWGARWAAKGPSKIVLLLAVCGGTAAIAWAAAAVAVARRPILLALATASVAATDAAGSARAEERPIRFGIVEATVEGQIWGVTPADLDQDGRADLVVFHVLGRKGPEPRRFLSVFYGSDGGYAPKPDQTIELGGDPCVYFVADVDPGAKGLELGYIGPRGAACFVATAKRKFDAGPRPLFEDDGFFDVAAGTQLPDWDELVKDVDGDGRADIAFPKKGRIALWLQRREGAGFTKAVELPAEYKQYFGTRVETLLLNRFINYWAALSKPVLVDADSDRKLDIVSYREGGLDLYLQRGGKFGADPDRTMKLKIVSDEASSGGGNDDSYNSVNAALDDVDGDGFGDIVFYRNVGKIGLFETMRTQVLYHRSRGKDGWREDQPDQILNLKGISINPALIDADKDGAKDLVVSSLRTDLVTNAKRALFSSVTITYYVFRYNKKEKRFSENPDYSRDLSIDIARIEGGGTIPLALFWGDYDGDGVPDLLSLEESDEVRILPGKVESGFFSGEALDYDEGEEKVVKIETSNSYKIFDLNHDGRSDFMFWYFDKNWESKDRGLLRVAISK